MKKILLALLTCLLACLCIVGLTACGDTPNTPTGEKEYSSTEGLEYTLSEDGTYYICSGIGTADETNIVIGSKYNGLPVTEIKDSAFYNCSSLQSITIPSSVTSIGEGAFYYCNNLTSITIPDSVTSIGEGAFYYCSSLQYNEYNNAKYLGNDSNKYLVLVKAISTNITSCTINENCKFIWEGAFFDCGSLESITIPSSVTSIGLSAFYNCSSLQSITIPSSVTSIGGAAFRDCSSLQYNEYNNAKYLGNDSNKYLVLVKAINTNITSCTINENCKFICEFAFFDCGSLESITIPSSVKSIGISVFYNCSSLTSVAFVENSKLTSIGGSAFYNCSSLQSITIPSSVTSIGEGAFYYCNNLTSITIPDSVTSIGYMTFDCCSSLTSINFNGTIEQWNSISKGDYWSAFTGNYTIYCTDGKIT